MPDDALDVAEARRAPAHTPDRATHAAATPDHTADVDDVADAVLVFEQHEKAGEEITHEALGAEPQRHPEHAGAGDQRRQVDPELTQRHEGSDGPDDSGDDAPEHVGHRLRPLDAARG